MAIRGENIPIPLIHEQFIIAFDLVNIRVVHDNKELFGLSMREAWDGEGREALTYCRNNSQREQKSSWKAPRIFAIVDASFPLPLD